MAHRPKSPCPVCAVPISTQGLTAHLRYKHPNYQPIDPTQRRQPTSIDMSDFERWKEGFVEGVLAGLKKAG